jgi:hypothetical protein
VTWLTGDGPRRFRLFAARHRGWLVPCGVSVPRRASISLVFALLSSFCNPLAHELQLAVNATSYRHLAAG